MSKPTVNEDMFGKYCAIPVGCSGAEHVYKIIKMIESNTYCDVSLYSGQTEEITHKDSVPVLLVTPCGLGENEVIRVPLAKCKICDDPNGWIRAKENLPDTVRTVMIYTKWGSVRYGWYNPELQAWFNRYGKTIRCVTHWRELPKPPRMEKCAK